MGVDMSEFAIYKGILYNTYKSTPDNNIILSSYNIKELSNGFKKIATRFNKVFGNFSIEKAVTATELDANFRINIFAIYHGIEFRFTFSADGSYTIWSQHNLERRKLEDSPDALLLIEMGFKHINDDLLKTIKPNECEEIFEIRKDNFFPKDFIPGVSKELKGGFIVTDYNNDKFPFITSRKTVFKNGIRMADFTEEIYKKGIEKQQ
jgi:hypothetical protein